MSSAKPKVLLLGEIEHATAREAYDTLSSVATLVTLTSTNRSDFLKECQDGTLNGTTAVYRTFNSVSVTGRIEGDVVEALSQAGVRYICHNGAGYDQIDVAACSKLGIHVSNVPSAVDAATADTAMFLLLGALRNFNLPMLSLRQDQWRGNPPPSLGHDPEGKILGILGMGGIGRNLARKAAAFDMEIQYHNRTPLSRELSGGAKYVSFDELLRTSDAISLNLPLNQHTRHIIGSAEFEKMKPDVVIVNTARGAVMDEDALVKALEEGKVSSCGLDVYEDEPEIHKGLVANPKVMLLPHLGTWTEETQMQMELWNISNVRSALETGRLRSQVPEQKDMPDV